MDISVSPNYPSRRGLDKDTLKTAIVENLVYSVGKDPERATLHDWFLATASAVRDRAVDTWMSTTRSYYDRDQKRVYYLSLEFLIGRLLRSTVSNLGMADAVREALGELGLDMSAVLEAEPDGALGNGGLGRLAACFLDSMANLGVAGYGYGIRYEFGLFEQGLDQGRQVERPERWLEHGNPWEFERAEVAYPVEFYGHVTAERGVEGERYFEWRDTERVLAVAYDTPVVGWGGHTVNNLRLWSARAPEDFDLGEFNRGDFMGAVQDRVTSETLSRVLYPNDATATGQELRLKQEYFFTSASLQDILRRFRQAHDGFAELPDKVVMQLNDTHPAIAVPELMRLLVDKYGVVWAEAWDITTRSIAYTNHTLMPEALERWPVNLLERLLPRHMQIIYELNGRFLRDLQKRGFDDAFLARVSLIDETGERFVRMGNLAFLGSFKVNGVSALHTQLVKQTVFADMHRLYPDRITNKTNGITPRRWLNDCNRPLAALVTETIGDAWIGDLETIRALEPFAEDTGFLERFREAKQRNKAALAQTIRRLVHVDVDPAALFDVQIKRIHEYKRQLLNLLQTIALYNEIRDHPTADRQPRVKIFAGKAAPAYTMAKLIIKLINDVARVINQDPAVRDVLKVAFLPDYNVSLAERIIPAADLSEQISTAGKEASGTGNMKFALNGALTIGTLDGANVEIRERVGPENIFIFGLATEEATALVEKGYRPRDYIERDPALKRALDMIAGGLFSPDDPGRFRPIVDDLLDTDRFLLAADFGAYVAAQGDVDTAFGDAHAWTRRAVLNTARVGWFSSDRTIRDYAEEIWKTAPSLAQAAE